MRNNPSTISAPTVNAPSNGTSYTANGARLPSDTVAHPPNGSQPIPPPFGPGAGGLFGLGLNATGQAQGPPNHPAVPPLAQLGAVPQQLQATLASHIAAFHDQIRLQQAQINQHMDLGPTAQVLTGSQGGMASTNPPPGPVN